MTLPVSRYRARRAARPSLIPLFLALTLGLSLRPATGQAQDWAPLRGHRTAAAAAALDLGRVPPSEDVPLTLGLAPRDPAGLEDLIRRQQDPEDPLYHHYLTPAQFAARFSPTPGQYAAVAAYARAQGLSVTGTTPNRLLLHVDAPSAAVENAFGVRLHRLQSAEGRLFRAPDGEPMVPAPLAPLLTGIAGLDTSALRRPHLRQLPATSALSAVPLEIGSGPYGGLTPSDIRTAYNLSKVSPTGAGQTLAVFELDGYKSSDIGAYESAFGLPSVTLQNIPVDGGSGRLNANGGQPEVTLDIELEIALAPGASKVLVYEGPNSGQGLLDTYNQIANDDLAKQVSTSWGLDEPDTGSSFAQLEAPIFQQMASQGQSVYAAAGDSGAYDNGSTLCVDDPASQPYVTGTGGTSLATSKAGGPYLSESVWDDGSGDAGGGGISSLWAIPSWQQGVVSAASLGSTTARNVPDVALDADPNTGYAIYVQGGWTIYGGTSCAAPLWTAFTALVNQQRLAGGAGLLGYANPALYAAAQGPFGSGDFHDITSGNNLYYPAVAGYDDATGWGTLNGANLLADLAPPPPANLTATASGTQISLTWNTVPSALSYTVLRGASHGGPYTALGTATSPVYTDTKLTSGTTYYYVVTAHTSAATSGNSSEASATTPAATATPPTVATAASASPNPVTGTTTALSVLGADAGGEAALTYTWSATGPAAVTFSASGTNAAKSSVATFTQAGAYTLTVTVQNGAGLTTTSSVAVTVSQTLTAIAVAPTTASVAAGQTQPFTAAARDQFGVALSPQPAFTWAATGDGTVSTTGLFTAVTAGPAAVTAASGSVTSPAAAVTVTAATTTTALASSLNPSTVSQSVTLTATVAGAGPTGTVTFTLDGAAQPAAALTGGKAALTTSSLAAGSHTVTAAYSGDGANAASASTTLTQTVQAPVITVSPASASVAVGGTQQFTASATGQGGAPLSPQPAFAWATTGGGTISAGGLFTAGGAAGGPYTVTASTGGVSGAASVTVTPQTTWLMSDPHIGHVIGRADSGGWSASTAQDPVGFMQYGPYTTQAAPGAHAVTWQLMVDNNTFTGDTGPVLELQVFDTTTGALLAVRDVQRREWAGAYRYQGFSAPFTLASPSAGHKLEFRVFWFRRSYVREQSVAIQ